MTRMYVLSIRCTPSGERRRKSLKNSYCNGYHCIIIEKRTDSKLTVERMYDRLLCNKTNATATTIPIANKTSYG